MTPSSSAAQETAGSIAAWLEALHPEPPPALRARLREMLAAHLTRPACDVPAACLAAAEVETARLLGNGSTGRGSALDLLSIDALMTYAFEEAANDPASLEALADAAMERL